MNKTKAIVFDAYGTLLYRPKQIHIYAGLQIASDLNLDSSQIKLPLIRNISFKEYADYLNVDISDTQLEIQLQEDINSIRMYQESIEVLKGVKEQGLKIIICSNLAQPYADPIKKYFNEYIDHYIFSFEVGVAKPDPEIYSIIEDRLGMTGKEIHMVGDNYTNDFWYPIRHGWTASYLDRKRKSKVLSISRLNSLFLDIS